MLKVCIVFFIFITATLSFAEEIKTFPVAKDFLACKKDADCQNVDPECDDCCGRAGINKKFVDQYRELKSKACKPEFVCDCAYTVKPVASCKSGLCVVK